MRNGYYLAANEQMTMYINICANHIFMKGKSQEQQARFALINTVLHQSFVLVLELNHICAKAL